MPHRKLNSQEQSVLDHLNKIYPAYATQKDLLVHCSVDRHSLIRVLQFLRAAERAEFADNPHPGQTFVVWRARRG